MADEGAEFFEVLEDVLRAPWFDLWHAHVDWEGKGDEDAAVRRENVSTLLEGLAFVHERMVGREFEAWVLLDAEDPQGDALYVHTPNPQSSVPADLGDVAWGVVGDPTWAGVVPRGIEIGRQESVDDEGEVTKLWFLRRCSSS